MHGRCTYFSHFDLRESGDSAFSPDTAKGKKGRRAAQNLNWRISRGSFSHDLNASLNATVVFGDRS